MFVLRSGKRNRWQEDPRQAALDLKPRPGETGVSVYVVPDQVEGRKIAILHAIVVRPQLEKSFEYVLIPRDHLGTAQLEQDPVDWGHSRLRDTHHVIRGLDNEVAREELARRAIGHSPTARLTRADIEAEIGFLAGDLEVMAALQAKAGDHTAAGCHRWQRLLDLMRVPPS